MDSYVKNESMDKDLPDQDNIDDYLDEDAKMKLRSLDPNFLLDKPLTEFQKSKSYRQEIKSKIC